MSPEIIGLLLLGASLASIIIGIPIACSMLPICGIGFLLIGGKTMLLQQFSMVVFNISSSYTFAVMPLFMLVGMLVGNTGLASGLYSSSKKWVGGIRGGLLYTTIIANAFFGACSGSSASGNAVFAKIAMPELRKEKYGISLSAACVTCAGSLAVLIPPSQSVLIFCLLADISIGSSLLAGLGGGLLLTVIMCLTVGIWTLVRPKDVPKQSKEDRASWKERLASLKTIVPILVIFMLVVGGSFLGWFTPTVGGGIASVACLIYALAIKVPLKDIFGSAQEAVQTFSVVFIMILGGMTFSRFIAITNIPQFISNAIVSSGLGKWGVYFVCVLFYLFCGCIMDIMSILTITIPILFPLLEGYGFSPYVILVTIVFLSELGSITPPVGFNVFSASILMKEEPVTIFKGVAPFFIADVITMILIGVFPVLTLWPIMILS